MVDPRADDAICETAVGDKLDERGKIKLTNLNTLLVVLVDPARRAGRARRSRPRSATSCAIRARRNTPPTRRAKKRATSPAFAQYIHARWGKPLPVGPALGDLLNEIVLAPQVYKKIVGMQMLVEGLAMGAFATLYQEGPRSADGEALPARDDGRGLPPQVRKDLGRPHDPASSSKAEARHGRGLGGARASRRCSSISASPDQKGWIYASVGLDPAWVPAGVHGSADRRRAPRGA